MFSATTKFAGKFKALFEILFQNMTTVCFTINKTGLYLETITTQNVLISLELPAQNFDNYVFDEIEPLHIGLGSIISKQFFNSVKNKDIVTFEIKKPYIFECIKQSEDYCVHTLAVSIEEIQNITPQEHDQYSTSPINIEKTTFNQMCRSFTTPDIAVTQKNKQIHFIFETGISTKTLTFGEYDKNDITLVHQSYVTDQITRIKKIAAFINKPIQVFVEKDKPLHFLCTSDIGVLKIFIPFKTHDL